MHAILIASQVTTLLRYSSLVACPAKLSDQCTCRRNIAFNNFPYGDVLGSEGRKALNACVKVKIYGTNRASAAARYQMYLTNPDWRDVSIEIDLIPRTYSLLPTTENWKTWYSFTSAYLIILTLMYIVSQTLFLTAVLDQVTP